MKTRTASPTFLRTSFTQTLIFTAKPDKATRRALQAAGYSWNGVSWWKNENQTLPINAKELEDLLTPVAQAEAATA